MIDDDDDLPVLTHILRTGSVRPVEETTSHAQAAMADAGPQDDDLMHDQLVIGNEPDVPARPMPPLQPYLEAVGNDALDPRVGIAGFDPRVGRDAEVGHVDHRPVRSIDEPAIVDAAHAAHAAHAAIDAPSTLPEDRDATVEASDTVDHRFEPAPSTAAVHVPPDRVEREAVADEALDDPAASVSPGEEREDATSSHAIETLVDHVAEEPTFEATAPVEHESVTAIEHEPLAAIEPDAGRADEPQRPAAPAPATDAFDVPPMSRVEPEPFEDTPDDRAAFASPIEEGDAKASHAIETPAVEHAVEDPMFDASASVRHEPVATIEAETAPVDIEAPVHDEPGVDETSEPLPASVHPRPAEAIAIPALTGPTPLTEIDFAALATQVHESVLSDLLSRIDTEFDARIAQAMHVELETALAALQASLRERMTEAMNDVVTRAVHDEMTRFAVALGDATRG